MAISRFRPNLTLAEAGAFLRASLPMGGTTPEEFERRFGDQVLEGRRVVLAPSGRIALFWILAGMELPPGSEVITQSFNFPAVPAAILATGAVPRFVDLKRDSFELDPDGVAAAIGPKTKAVLVTHLYGNAADLDPIREICEDKGVTLLEDCGQAVGAAYKGRTLGTIGYATLFTFGATKNFTILGGGAVACGDPAHGQRVADLASENPRVGRRKTLKLATSAAGMSVVTSPLPFNLGVFPVIRVMSLFGGDPIAGALEEKVEPLTGVERAQVPSGPMASVGMTQLDRLDEMNRTRERNGWYLRSRLMEQPGLTLPPAQEGSVFLSFPVFHERRDDLSRALQRRGVDSTTGFMMDCSTLDLFDHRGGPCPETQRALDEILHIPVHPFLRRKHLDWICEATEAALREVCRQGGRGGRRLTIDLLGPVRPPEAPRG